MIRQGPGSVEGNSSRSSVAGLIADVYLGSWSISSGMNAVVSYVTSRDIEKATDDEFETPGMFAMSVPYARSVLFEG